MDFIDRDLLLKDIGESVVFSVRSGYISPELRGARKIIDRIKQAPTADVVEVKHGEWIEETRTQTPLSHAYIRKEIIYSCPYCKKEYRQKMNYCGNCGANLEHKCKTEKKVCDLKNKCGSCVFSKPTNWGSKPSKTYVECTNAEHIKKYCKDSLSRKRAKTTPACKSYKERGGENRTV